MCADPTGDNMWVTISVNLLLLLLFEISGLSQILGSESSVQNLREISYRLSNSTEPISYELWLSTNIHEAIRDYTGRVKIALRANYATNTVMLNSEGLSLHNYTLRDLMNNPLKISDIEEQELRRTVTFSLEEELKPDEVYIFEIYFNGQLQRVPNGFCYSSYVDEYGETKYFAVTHMHVFNARKVFPCYDEPRYRTPFTIHLTHHSSLHAVSNVPPVQVSNQ